jgi:AraC family transcriptional regulator of adaptative response/methylated-DNA-[protein]-cysteine methyltransferase
VRSALGLLEAADEPLRLEALAERLGVSKFYLHRQFKEHVGMTPRQYVESLRMKKTRDQLSESASVTRAVHHAGYSSGSRFYARSGALGMSPTSVRRRGAGQTIRYTSRRTSLGQLLVAATAEGVCAVSLGNDSDTLEQQLKQRFSQADFATADARVRLYARRIAAWVEQGRTPPPIPLDLLATRFQLRVYEVLQSIPPGTTLSYQELASRLGLSHGARAVGRACAENPVALLIPCHRVTRKDGGLGGYRWGLEQKQKLLARERNR